MQEELPVLMLLTLPQQSSSLPPQLGNPLLVPAKCFTKAQEHRMKSLSAFAKENTIWVQFTVLCFIWLIIFFFKSSLKAFHITKVKLTGFHFLDQKGFKV